MKVIKLLHFLKPRFEIFALTLIIILGFTLRVYHLDTNPPGFFCDEASIGYDAYSILNTGKDVYGVRYPIFFRSLGDYRPPLSIYTTIPFVALFGLNEFSVRFTSVFFGTILILLMYFLGKLLHSKSLGLLSAFITATMPWLFHYNRTGFEFSLYCTFFTATVFLFVKSSRDKAYIIPAFIASALTLYTYQPAKLIIPLLLIGIGFIYLKTFLKYRKETLYGLFIFYVISLPLIYTYLTGEATARFDKISVFSAKLTLAHTLFLMIRNYFIQISHIYFLYGEPTFITRHFINGLIPLLITTLPFVLIGVFYIFLTFNKSTSRLLIFWFAIYPIAGAITAEGPFTSRSIIGAPLFALLISLGIIKLVNYSKKFVKIYLSLIFIIFMILINLGFFIHFYFVSYPLYSADFWGWQYGAREIIQYFTAHEKEYDDLFMAPDFNAAPIFLFFYAPHSCNKCMVGHPEAAYVRNRKQIFSVTPSYMDNHTNFIYKPVKTIYYPNGNTAFVLVEILHSN